MNIPRNETGNPKATQKASLEFKKSDKKGEPKASLEKYFLSKVYVFHLKCQMHLIALLALNFYFDY